MNSSAIAIERRQELSNAGAPPLVESSAKTLGELLERVYAEHLPIVWKVARAFTRSRAEQDDVVQEILAALCAAAGRVQQQRWVAISVYQLACSHVLNRCCAARPRPGPRIFDGDMPELQRACDATGHALLDRIYDVLPRFDPLDRVLCLLTLDGLGDREIKQILGISEDDAGERAGRCKRQLLAWLKGEANAA